jgi:hypothetical protein
MRLRKPSPAIIVALVALVIALGGTAIAASHYIITSTSQIKPSVLKELLGRPGAPTARAARVPGKAKVTSYATRILTGDEPPAAVVLEIPNIAVVKAVECNNDNARVYIYNFVPERASEAFLALSNGQSEQAKAGWEHLTSNDQTESNLHIMFGTGTTTTVADITVITGHPTATECAFTATAQVYKG